MAVGKCPLRKKSDKSHWPMTGSCMATMNLFLQRVDRSNTATAARGIRPQLGRRHTRRRHTRRRPGRRDTRRCRYPQKGASTTARGLQETACEGIVEATTPLPCRKLQGYGVEPCGAFKNEHSPRFDRRAEGGGLIEQSRLRVKAERANVGGTRRRFLRECVVCKGVQCMDIWRHFKKAHPTWTDAQRTDAAARCPVVGNKRDGETNDDDNKPLEEYILDVLRTYLLTTNKKTDEGKGLYGGTRNDQEPSRLFAAHISWPPQTR